MKNYPNMNLVDFDVELQRLSDENSKEKIDKLSFIAINHSHLAKEIVEMIFKKIETAQKVESRINFLYLIDSICKDRTPNSSRFYRELFETRIGITFVKIYIQSSHSEPLKKSLRLLRMTWRNIFSEPCLEEMRNRIRDLEREDIETNFNEDERQKLISFYRKNDIALHLWPKSLRSVPIINSVEKPERIEPQPIVHPSPPKAPIAKSLKHPAQGELDGDKIKKKIKKNPISARPPQKLDNLLKEDFNRNQNVFHLGQNQMKQTPIQQTPLPAPQEPQIKPQMIKPKEVVMNQGEVNPQQNTQINRIVQEDKKNLTMMEKKEEETLKEKVKNLFGNGNLVFYNLYKSFKDEMSKQMGKKTTQITNIKTKHEFVVNSLYSDLRFKCNSCGMRFSHQSKIMEHLDRHFVANKYLFDIQKRDKMIERSEFLRNDEWLSFETVPEASQANFNNTNEETEHWIEADLTKNNYCALCGENFVLKYLAKKELWIFKDVVLVDVEEKKLTGVPFHSNCYKIALAQEEETEYLNEVNFIKKNETNVNKSKTDNKTQF